MFEILGDILSVPLKIADAGARIAIGGMNALSGEEPRCGKTVFGDLADEVKDAFNQE